MLVANVDRPVAVLGHAGRLKEHANQTGVRAAWLLVQCDAIETVVTCTQRRGDRIPRAV